MSIKPQEFLRSAEELAATDAREVHQRNAISRLYYAAYHRTCEYIEPDGKDRRNDNGRRVGSHRNYIEQLKECDSGTPARKLGVSLSVVYSGRIRADYKLTEDVIPREFPMHLNRTRDIFTLIDATPTPPPVHRAPVLQIIR